VEDFAVGLAEDFEGVGEGLAPGCGGAEEDLECRIYEQGADLFYLLVS